MSSDVIVKMFWVLGDVWGTSGPISSWIRLGLDANWIFRNSLCRHACRSLPWQSFAVPAERNESERPACSHFASKSADRKCQWQGRSNVRCIPEDRALALSKRIPARTCKPVFLFLPACLPRRSLIVANYSSYCYFISLS